MKKLLAILLGLCLCKTSLPQNISRHEADSLVQALAKSASNESTVTLLLKLAKFHIYKQGEYKTDLDSGMALIQQAEQLTTKLQCAICRGQILLTKSYYLRETGQKELAKTTGEAAIRILKEEKNNPFLAEAYFEQSEYYEYDTNLEEKTALVEQALSCFQPSSPIERKAFYYKVLADLYLQKSDRINMSKSLHALDSSLKYYQSIHYAALQGVYIVYSTVYFNTSDYSHALRYSLLALQAAEQDKDSSIQLCQINNITGIIYARLKQLEKALPYLYNGLAVGERYKDIDAIYLLLHNICVTNLELNKATEAETVLNRIVKKYPQRFNGLTLLAQIRIRLLIATQLNRIKEVEYYCGQMAALLKHAQFEPGAEMIGYQTILEGYLKLRHFALVRYYLNKQEQMLKLIPFSNKTATFYKHWFRLDTATGDYKAAVFHLQEFNKANDSIFNQEKTQQMQQLEVEYNTAENVKNIQLLTQEKKIQIAELKRSALIRNIVISAVAFLLVILFLLYKQFTLKQKTNAAINKKNALLQHVVEEKEWLLKEVHHRVKNNLHTVISLLESQAAYLENDALKAIESSQHRIYAMSLIHQKLYQAEDVKAIDMSVYLPEFIRYLDESFDLHYKITFNLDIEPINLSISQAIPIALIINEAVTNSIKYAFPGNIKGNIEITMHKKANQVTLVIADNGIGINEAVLKKPLETLGLKLIKGLSGDINASCSFEVDNGTKITLVFALDSFVIDNPLPAVVNQEQLYV